MNPELPAHHVSPSMKVIMLVFAVVLIATLGWLVWDNNTTPDTTDSSAPKVTKTTTTTDETADWKTYTSSYGYSVKYPATWTFNATNTATVTLTSPETTKSINDCIKTNPVCEGAGADIAVYYYSSISEEASNKANKWNAKTIEELITADSLTKKLGTVSLGGVNATAVQEAGLGSYYVIYAEKNGHLYRIFFNNRETESSLSATEKLILSNFKFTN